ncbi:MAG: phosphoribosyltransferase [Bacteroidia bacterium]|nr:phosphoribosyltransferase [Bacteroidia bacterium]MCC6767763.1 phosphoribosyltransferase [Bacteroidia bacterium]
MTRKSILQPIDIHRKLERMALEMLERTEGELIIVGIESTGFHLAEIITRHLETYAGKTFRAYRVKIDKSNPLMSMPQTDVPVELFDGATLILVDDVQNSGKTMMYTIRHFLQYPVKSVQTCVLVDRRHNSFPVRSDYIGLSLSTTLEDHVVVEMSDKGLEACLV